MIRGIDSGAGSDPLQRSAFRTSFFAPEGAVGAYILECQVFDHNLVNWTVDVQSKYDQKQYFGIQVSSPYMHWQRGEGVYAMPDLGAKCHVCIPSDSTPPYVLDFIMPMETVPMAGTEGALDGTDGPKQHPAAASLAGGRVRAKPGDLIMRGRDGNFCILHRGGVLQVGASELAQRLYIPLQNLITDISQNYDHLNTGGSLRWYVDGSESDDNPGNVYKHTLRLRTQDELASLRIVAGKVRDVVREVDSEILSDLNQLGFTGADTMCEVTLAPDSINAGDGSLTSDTPGATVLRYFFDKNGNCALRTKGHVYLNAKKQLRVHVSEDITIQGKANFTLVLGGAARIQADTLLELTSGMIRVNGGSQPIATVGSQVQVAMMPGITMSMLVPPATAPVIATVVAGPVLTGTVMSGVPNFLAGG
jgi:hypothetical protein